MDLKVLYSITRKPLSSIPGIIGGVKLALPALDFHSIHHVETVIQHKRRPPNWLYKLAVTISLTYSCGIIFSFGGRLAPKVYFIGPLVWSKAAAISFDMVKRKLEIERRNWIEANYYMRDRHLQLSKGEEHLCKLVLSLIHQLGPRLLLGTQVLAIRDYTAKYLPGYRSIEDTELIDLLGEHNCGIAPN